MNITQTALSGALAAQAGLSTTSHNIANVMTPGFTRQGALFAAVGPTLSGPTVPGTGVTVPALLRFSDSYKSQQMWRANAELGQYTVSQPYMRQLEQVMGDDGSNLNKGLDMFFGALNAASVDPTSAPLRQQVVSAAEALALRFNSLNQVLINQRLSVAQQREATVSQINGLSRDIAVLNEQIAASRSSGVNPSGLIDARDLKIDELAGLVGLQVVDQPDGTRSVSLRSGVPLVAGAIASTLSVQGNPDGSHDLKLSFANESFTLHTDNLGGQLGGLEDFEARALKPLMASVSSLAQEVAQRVNTQLAAGYTMSGVAGVDLFEIDGGSNGLLKLRPGVLGDELAFSSDPAQPGDSSNLLLLIDLRNQPAPIDGLGSVRLGDVHTQLVGRLGMQSQQNQASMDTARTVRNQAEESWKATSGVNTDEEAVNLIQYQQMYQANMRVIAVANQLFDATLASFG